MENPSCSSTTNGSSNTSCVFCKLSSKTDEEQKYFYYDDDVFVVADIRPATQHHYLVVSRQHIKDAKQLTRNDVDFLKKMINVGCDILKQQLGNGVEIDHNELRLGFHWPPFHLVQHLHLHVLYPYSEMTFIARNFLFNTSLSFVFVTADWMLVRLENMPAESVSSKL